MPRTESQLDLTAITEHIDGPSESHDRSPDTSRQRPRSSDDLRKKTLTKSATTIPTIGKTREEQRQFQARRAEEIYSDMREVKQLERQRSTKVARSVEQRWKESEERAKAFERTRKASFNKARQISKKHPNIDETQLLEGIPEQRKKELQQKIMTPARYAPQQPAREDRGRSRMRKSSIVRPGTKPKTQDHVVMWFRENEAPRGRCRERDGTICLWFHGRLGRTQAEGLLEERSVGSYLVRLSANNWGYTISVKGYENVKHFIVDVSSGQYQFSGVERRFSSLRDLLTFYRGNPITRLGQEILLVPVAQLEDEDSVNFRGLFREVEPKEAKITHL
jgi:SH2 domain-containing protein 4A